MLRNRAPLVSLAALCENAHASVGRYSGWIVAIAVKRDSFTDDNFTDGL